MTIPSPATAPPLRTADDVLDRVRQLVGTATVDHQLWLMFVDGDGRQAPAIVPITDVPRLPDLPVVENLGTVLAGVCRSLDTVAGPGSAFVTLERLGPDTVQDLDRKWAVALSRACERADVILRGFYLATVGGVRQIPL